MKLSIIGGDRRMATVSEKLNDYGLDVVRAETEPEIMSAITETDIIVMPFPAAKKGFLNAPMSVNTVPISKIIKPGKLYLGGHLPIIGNNIIDYAESEELLLGNALITAEAAIEIAMGKLERTLCGSKAVILGNGRIASYLAEMLVSLGVRLTSVARSDVGRKKMADIGGSAVGFENFEAPLTEADVIFNTVPATVLNDSELRAIGSKTPIIDLASLPGGVDEYYAEFYNSNLIRALSLPGKYAPITAGELISKTVIKILRERGLVQ